MRALDIANMFIVEHGSRLLLTNLKLNKLVYCAYVTFLRESGGRLFPDPIEAWDCGPAERDVHAAFEHCGRERITMPYGRPVADAEAERTVAFVVEHYGFLSAFDMVNFSHRPEGAWYAAHKQGEGTIITDTMILSSADGVVLPDRDMTLAAAIEETGRRYRNTFRLLAGA